MTKAIYKHDFNLLAKSEITKSNPELLDVMSKYPHIDLEELKEISTENYNFFKNIYSRVKNQAVAEWVGALEQDIKVVEKSQNIKCELCNASIINVCTIHNKFNGNKMNIGTECNNKFNFFNPNDVEYNLKKQREFRKINKINTLLPELNETMINWRRLVFESPLYIFENLSDAYMQLGDTVKNLNKEYVSKKISMNREDEIINDIKKTIRDAEPFRNEITNFIDENSNNHLYPTKKMVDSLRESNSPEQGKEFLEQDGIITLRTLYRFRDKDFAIKIINILNREMQKEGAVIVDVYSPSKKNLGYYVRFNENKYCKFYYKYEYICWLFGACVTGEEENIEEFNKESFIKEGKLVDRESIEAGLLIIEKILNNIDVELMEYYPEFGEVLWKVLKKDDSDKAKFYYKTNINKLKAILKDLLLSLKKYDGRQLYDIIKVNSTKINNGEIKDFLKSRNSV